MKRIFPMLLAGALYACHRAPAPPTLDDTADSDAAAPATQAPTPAAKPRTTVPGKLRATGTEPFWSVAIDGNRLVYSTPDYPNGIRVSAMRREADGGKVTYTASLDGKPLSLEIAVGACSDGMSDKVYTFTAIRQIGPDIARGCADAS